MIHINGLIIVISVYLNNHDNENNYNTLVNCFKQLRNVYPNEKIVAIDNKSPNNKWHNIINSLNIELLINESDDYRYELGAYKYCLSKYSADKYIFIQGNIYMNKQITEELSECVPDVYLFGKLYGLYWDDNGLNLINNRLQQLNMYNWTNEDPIVLWNCFYCNDLCLKELQKSGIFDLICNTKYIACSNERILGCVLFRNIIKEVKTIDRSTFQKNFFGQN
jgi:hypothetical protein